MEEFIFGKNAVKEALSSDEEINKIFVQKDARVSGLTEIVNAALDKKIVVSKVDKRKLDDITEGGNHQGIVAMISPYRYLEVEDLIAGKEQPLLMILDSVQDPHNLGAILRTAYAAGVDGVIIPKRRSASVNGTVVKASGGYALKIPIARVTNLAKTIDYLKEKNIFVAGADAGGGSSLFAGDFKGSMALVVGNEGEGLSRLVREKCDFLISIPMKNEVESLNVSVAASLMIYEALRQRG